MRRVGYAFVRPPGKTDAVGAEGLEQLAGDNADGSDSRILLEGNDVMPLHILHLVWSPDGRRLALDSGRTESTYVVNADGSGSRSSALP